MAGETLEMQVVVDANQAITQLARFDQETKKTLSAVEIVDRKILGLEKDLNDLSMAMVKGGANSAAYANQMRNIERELDAVNGKVNQSKIAIAGLSKAKAVLSGSARDLGYDLLIVSYAVDDLQYGIKGILNNIPQVVTAIAGPGSAGLAGAISIAAVAGTFLYDKLKTDIPEGTKEGVDAAKKHLEDLTQAISDADKELNDLVLGASRNRIAAQRMAVESAIQETNRARAAFTSQFGIDPTNINEMDRIASLAQGDRDVWIQRWNAQENQMEEVQVSAKAVMQEYAKTTDAYQLAVDEQVLLGKYEAIEKERLAQETQDAAIESANAITKAEEDASKDRVKNYQKEAEYKYDIFVAGLKDEEDQLREAAKASRKRNDEKRKREAKELADDFKLMDKEKKEAEKAKEKTLKEREKAEEKHLDRLRELQGKSLGDRLAFDDLAKEVEMSNLDRLKNHEWKTLQERIKYNRSFYDSIGKLAEESTQLAISLGQEYIDMRITGAENAEAVVAQKFIKGVGDQVVAEGTKYLIQGAGMSLIGDPRGLGLMALGGTAIAVGAGMGASATAWSHTMAGGKIGQALPEEDKAKRDRGASPRSSRGGASDGGPLIVNVSYGVGGPLPEDTAREIAKVMKTGNRRRGAA